ncbi:MAG: PKD domain-containing protein, partial [Candidatus Jacksonbacteria bacterium]
MSSFYPTTAHKSIIRYLLLGLIKVKFKKFIFLTLFLVVILTSVPEVQAMSCGATMSRDVTLACTPISGTVDFSVHVQDYEADDPKCGRYTVYVGGYPGGVAWTMTDNVCGSGYPEPWYWQDFSIPANTTRGWQAGLNSVVFLGECCGWCGSFNMDTINYSLAVNYPEPVADFTGSPTSGPPGLTVNFTDASTDCDGSVNSWSWEFGDSGTSSLQNPSHTYTSAGTYTVRLTVTGEGGNDPKTRTNYITVTPPIPPAPTGLTHTDNTITSISWDWNDSTGATYYQLWDNWCTTKIQDSIANSNYTENVGSANTQRTRKVKACNGSGCSACSTAASAYTSANTPVSLAGTVPAGVDGRTKINWSWSSGGVQKDFYASNSAGNTGWTTAITWNQTGLTCNKTYTLTVKARNGDNDETSGASWNQTTSACNQAPYWSPAIPDITNATENTPISYNVSIYANDGDGDVLTFQKVSGPAGLTISTTGIINWTPSYTEAGIYNVTVYISDDWSGTTDTFQITV